jgi:hypothetical protein
VDEVAIALEGVGGVLARALNSPNVPDKNLEPANVVDALAMIADALNRVADAIEGAAK